MFFDQLPLGPAQLAGTTALNYDAWQQTFGQAWAAYTISGVTGNQTYLQQLIEEQLPSAIQQYGTGWQPAFGPIAYKEYPDETDTTADNVWFVSHNPSVVFEDGNSYSTYVVSVAGTQKTPVDYLDDLDVGSVVDLDAWAAGDLASMPDTTHLPDNSQAQISSGIAYAVQRAITAAAPDNTSGPLNKWLTSVSLSATSPTKFIFTGHSEGAPISLALAYLYVTSGTIKQNSNVGVRFFTLAGPSPGNQAYVDAVESLFPPVVPGSAPSYGAWNLNIVNTLDIVPYAWCWDKWMFGPGCPPSNMLSLSNIPAMYGAAGSVYAKTLAAVSALVASSSTVNTYYYPHPYQAFTGTPPTTLPSDFDDWAGMAWCQHVQGYCMQFFGSLTTPPCHTALNVTPDCPY